MTKLLLLIRKIQAKRKGSSFTSKYKLTNLEYYEELQFIDDAISREKQLLMSAKKHMLSLRDIWIFINSLTTNILSRWDSMPLGI